MLALDCTLRALSREGLIWRTQMLTTAARRSRNYPKSWRIKNLHHRTWPLFSSCLKKVYEKGTWFTLDQDLVLPVKSPHSLFSFLSQSNSMDSPYSKGSPKSLIVFPLESPIFGVKSVKWHLFSHLLNSNSKPLNALWM